MGIKRIFAPIILAAIATGCATNSDIERVQTQIDGVQFRVSVLETSIADLRTVVKRADDNAAKAQVAAEQAALSAAETNAKLDRLFKLSQKK